uniref:Transcription initiation factor IIF subunit alpha n=1 Tax=Parascaris equorum TaxID=6256 RepID=A0A914S3F4_PAREQ
MVDPGRWTTQDSVHIYQVDSQPWRLTVEDQSGKERKFRSIREGGAGEHADYWIFMKSGGEFHAHKVDDWYQFLPCIQHPAKSSDESIRIEGADSPPAECYE